MDAKIIWDYLLQKTGNEYGTAAIMGNLMAESSLNPTCATGKNKVTYYARAADNGEVDFVNDGVAFGLVQWCYHTRKAGLLEYAKKTGRSVGDLQTQLEYLVKEMSESYKTVWKAVTEAKDIRTASDIVMLKYEKPATTSEAAKKKRADYGKLFYIEYGIPDPETQQKTENAVKTQQTGKRVRAKVNVNVRTGPGTMYPKKFQLAKGQELELIEKDGNWYKVAMYVMADYAEVVS